MIGDFLARGFRAAGHLRLVAFDALLTLVAFVPLIAGVSASLLASVEGMEHWLGSSDPRLRSLAVAEVIDQAQPGAAFAGIVSTLVLLLLFRTLIAGGLASCVSHHTRPAIHEVISSGARNFGINVAITLVWIVLAGLLVTVAAGILIPVWYLTTGKVHVFFAGAVVGFFGALTVMLYAALRTICDLARVVRRVHPLAGAGFALRTARRWFMRVPITAGTLGLVWILLVVLIELATAAVELSTGTRSWAGVIVFAAVIVLVLVARSAVTVARYASFSSLGELLWNFEQDEENERWLTAVPQALWMLPPIGDASSIDEDWPDWIPIPGSRDIDH